MPIRPITTPSKQVPSQSTTGLAFSIHACCRLLKHRHRRLHCLLGDDGDLKGVSASSCETTALSQSFLLSGTATGTTQQLIIANPSTKPTTVEIKIWGSKQSGEMALSTQSSLAIPASGENALDLAAAAPDQQGLYVTVSSKETPIAAVVRTVSMNGLTSKGSDFALPLHDASNASVATSIAKGDAVDAYLYAASATGVTLSWITEHGLVQAKDATLQANRVTVVDLGEAPEDALGVMSTAEDDVAFSVKASQSGDDDQADSPDQCRGSGFVHRACHSR